MLKTYSRKRKQENNLIEDVHDLCRLCLARAEEPVPIFGDVNNACAALPMRIMICVGHEVTQDDCLPNSICTNCHQELEKYYKFRKKCENSYRRLKAHYNTIKNQEKLSDGPKEVEECKQLEEESQAEDIERLVIVDMFKAESNEEVEKVEETTEIQVIEQTDEMNPDISTFLNAILVELGILVKNDQGLVLQDQGVTSFQLETGDDDQLEFELIEEDEEEDKVTPPLVITLPKITNASENEESKSTEATINGRARKNNTDGKKSGAWCAVCGRGFSSASARRRHERGHGGARPFACARCPRRFAQRAVLTRHELVHDAVRPFACAECPKSFTQRGALEAHARSHGAGARALRLHACTRCDRVFLYASGLSRHMLTHSGHMFACGTCQRLFNDKSSLLRHVRTTHPQETRPA